MCVGCSLLLRKHQLTFTRKTFKKRAAEIADHAHNSRGAVGEGVDFLRGLDETERQRMCTDLLQVP